MKNEGIEDEDEDYYAEVANNVNGVIAMHHTGIIAPNSKSPDESTSAPYKYDRPGPSYVQPPKPYQNLNTEGNPSCWANEDIHVYYNWSPK